MKDKNDLVLKIYCRWEKESGTDDAFRYAGTEKERRSRASSPCALSPHRRDWSRPARADRSPGSRGDPETLFWRTTWLSCSGTKSDPADQSPLCNIFSVITGRCEVTYATRTRDWDGGSLVWSVNDGRCPLFLPQWMPSLGPCPHFPLSSAKGVHGCIRGPNPPRVESKGPRGQLPNTVQKIEISWERADNPSSGRRHGRYCVEEKGGSWGGSGDAIFCHSTVTASASVPAAVGSRNMQGLSHWGDGDSSQCSAGGGCDGRGAGCDLGRREWVGRCRCESRRAVVVSGWILQRRWVLEEK